jgi:hypothetical protein
MLEALELAGLQPEVRGRLVSTSPDGSFAVEIVDDGDARRPLALAGATAERILVHPEPLATGGAPE